jgi:hypothetical protein
MAPDRPDTSTKPPRGTDVGYPMHIGHIDPIYIHTAEGAQLQLNISTSSQHILGINEGACSLLVMVRRSELKQSRCNLCASLEMQTKPNFKYKLLSLVVLALFGESARGASSQHTHTQTHQR